MENDIKKRANKEKNRIKRIMKDAKIHAKTMSLLEPVVENTAWMKVKLDDARELVGEEMITVEYDNGGGQKGIRENPNIKAYEALWKSYALGIQRIYDAVMKESSAEEPSKDAGSNVLQLLRAKKEA